MAARNRKNAVRKPKLRIESLEDRSVPAGLVLDVNTTQDLAPANDATLTLREAITAANAATEPVTINLPAGTYQLTRTGVDDSNAAGDLDVTGTGITIVGAGNGATIIDGNETDRVFDVKADADLRVEGVKVQNGRADFGGGVRNAGTFTMLDGGLHSNHATTKGPAFHGLAGSQTTLVNVPLTENTLDGGNAAELVSDLVSLLKQQSSKVVDGVDEMFGSLKDGLTNAFGGVKLPIIGDKLEGALKPIVDGLEKMRVGVRNLVDAIFNLPDPTSGPPLTEVVRGGLYLALGPGWAGADQLDPAVRDRLAPLSSMFAALGLGLVKDGIDSGDTVSPGDVTLTLGQDGSGFRNLQLDVHLGQEYQVDSPGFDLGLNLNQLPVAEPGLFPEGTVLPGFGFDFEGTGVRLDLEWDARLGLGVSEKPGEAFYLVSDAVDEEGEPVEELRASASAYAIPTEDGSPGLKGELALGLTRAVVTDGTPAKLKITAENGLKYLTLPGAGTTFTIKMTGEGVDDREETITSSIGATGATLPFVMAELNAKLAFEFGNILTSPVSFVLDFDPENAQPILVLVVRDSDYDTVKITGAQELGFAAEQEAERTVDDTDRTKLSLVAAIDIVDPNGDGRLTLSEMQSAPFNELFVPVAQAEAAVRLHVNTDAEHLTGFIGQQTGLGADGLSLPAISFDLIVDASVDFTSLAQQDEAGRRRPTPGIETLQFDNITLDVRKFLDTVVLPLAQSAAKALDPIIGVLGNATDDPASLLNKRIPYLSDILDKNITVADVLKAVGVYDEAMTVVEFVHKLTDFADTAVDYLQSPDFLALSENGKFTFGGLELVMDAEHPLYFGKVKAPIPIDLKYAFDAFQEIELVSFMAQAPAISQVAGAGFQIDLFSPKTVFNFLLGEPVDLVSFGLPEFNLGDSDPSDGTVVGGFSFDELSLEVKAGATLNSNLRIVYDTLGIQKVIEAAEAGESVDYSDLLDGFYILNNTLLPELGVGAYFVGEATVDLSPVFYGHGEVGAEVWLRFDILDPNEDGKLRLDEIMALTNDFKNPENLFKLFEITGKAEVHASGEIKFGGIGFEGDTGLVGGDFSLQDLLSPLFDEGTLPPETPVFAQSVTEGGQTYLRINMGRHAADRIHGDTDDSTGVNVHVVQSGSNFAVSINGAPAQNYSGLFSKVVATGGDAGDTIDLSQVQLAVEVEGGGGNDTISGGLGIDTIDAGDGNDWVDAGLSNDLVLGGDGNDTLKGNGGNDTILGGDGHDSIEGGTGNDALTGERGDDTLKGDAGDDTLAGSIGNDVLEGGDNRDTLLGERGEDTLRGGAGSDALDGGEDADHLFGDADNDTLAGGLANDALDGGAGEDELFGEGGNDTLTGGGQRDRLAGNDGDDSLVAGRGDRLVDGGADADILNFDDSAATSTINARLTATRFEGDAGEVPFVGVEKIEVNLGSGNDQFTVVDTVLPTTVRGGAGADTITVLRTSAPLSVDGSADAATDRLVLDYRTELNGLTGTIGETAATGFGRVDIGYVRIDQLEVQLGGGADRVTVTGTPALTRILGEGGNDVVTVADIGPAAGTAYDLEMFGGSGADEVVVGVAGTDVPRNLGNLKFGDAVEKLTVRDSDTAVMSLWTYDQGELTAKVGSAPPYFALNAAGAGETFLDSGLAGATGGDMLTVIDDANLPQTVVIGDEAVRIKEGQNVLDPAGFSAAAGGVPVLSADGTRLYMPDATGNVLVYDRDPATGALTLVQTPADWVVTQTLDASVGTVDEAPVIATGGDLMVVASSATGKATVFRKGADVWVFEAELTASRAGFGASVATDGNTVVVGYTGSPYGGFVAYRKNGQGTWIAIASIGSSSNDAYFGHNVAVAGDYVASAAPGYQGGKGLVSVLKFNPANVQTGMDGIRGYVGQSEGTYLGRSLAMTPGRLYMGSMTNTLFVGLLSGSTWQDYSVASPDSNDPNANFTGSLAASGDRVVVGAPGINKAYVFEWTSSGEFVRRTIVPGEATTSFGMSVDIDGNRLVVGTEDGASNRGSAYVFQTPGVNSAWTLERELALPGSPYSTSHSSVGIRGGQILLGDNTTTATITVHENLLGTIAPGAKQAVLSPSGGFLYAASPNGVVVFEVTPTKELKAKQALPVSGSGGGVTMSPDGRFLFVTNPGAYGVTRLSIDPATGRVSQPTVINLVAAGGPVTPVLFVGTTLAVQAGQGYDDVTFWNYDANSGTFSNYRQQANGLNGLTGMVDPTAVTADPTGTHFYVAASAAGQDTITVFRMVNGQPQFVGQLANNAPGLRGLVGISALTVSPDGKFVFATGKEGDSLIVLNRNATTGLLSPAQRLGQGTLGAGGLDAPIAVFAVGTGSDYLVHTVAAGSGPASPAGVGTFKLSPIVTPKSYDVSFRGVSRLDVRTGGGSDGVQVGNVTPDLVLYTGVGDDTVVIQKTGGGIVALDTGEDADRVSIRGSGGQAIVVKTRGGSDHVDLVRLDDGDAANIDLGAGADTATVNAGNLFAEATVIGGADADAISIDPAGRTVTGTFNGNGTLATPNGEVTASQRDRLRYQEFETAALIAAPVVTAEHPPVVEGLGGQPITLTASAVSPANSAIVSYSWDLDGDGSFGDATGPSVPLTWAELKAFGIDDNGIHAIGVRATDAAGRVGEGLLRLTVENTKPTVTMSLPNIVGAGDPMKLGLNYVDPGDDTITAVTVDWGDGTVVTHAGRPAELTHTYAPGSPGGAKTVKVTSITDEDGTHTSTAERTIVVGYVAAPTRTLAGLAVANEGSDYVLTLSSAGYGRVDGWVINWGDGTTEEISGANATRTHRFDGPATYTITALVKSNDTYTAADNTLTVAAANAAPTVTATGATTAVEGNYALTLSATDVGPDKVQSWSINWGDGTTTTLPGTALGATHLFDRPGTFDIVATAIDEDGSFAAPKVTVAVSNANPVITGIANLTPAAVEGDAVSVRVSASDVSAGGLTYEFDFDNDGTFEPGNQTGLASHVFTASGSHVVNVRVKDAFGGQATGSITVDVGEAAPVIDTVEVSPADEGRAVAFHTVAFDRGGDALSYSFDFDGDGVFDQTSTDGTASHVFADSGTYPVTVRVADAAGFTDRVVNVVVRDVSPTLDMSAVPGEAVRGTPYVFHLDPSTITDPGLDTVTGYRILWGDGSSSDAVGLADVSHTYTAEGNVTLRVVLIDEDGEHPTAGTKAIAVVRGNTPPVAVGDSVTTLQGEAVTLNPAANDTDVDGDALTVTAVGQPAHGMVVLNANGTVTYTPQMGYAGPSDSFSYTVSDGKGGTETGTVSVTITPIDGRNPGVYVVGDVLLVIGSGSNDWVSITKSGATGVQVSATLGNQWVSRSYPGPFRLLHVAVYDGNDGVQISDSVTIPAVVRGGAGNDSIETGGGADRVFGDLEDGTGTGNDTIFTRGGDDTVLAGGGNNWIDVGSGNNTVRAGEGNDGVAATAGYDDVNLGNGNNTADVGEGGSLVVTGSGNDWIRGGSGIDVVRSGGGTDSVDLLGGNDDAILLGGGWVSGGDGDDSIVTGTGTVTVNAGNGDDFVKLGSGKGDVDGGAGSDILLGGAGNDNLRGGAGNDLIAGGFGSDYLSGDAGRDLLFDGDVAAADANDTLRAILNYANPMDAANLAQVRQRLTVTRDPAGRDTLNGGADRDSFWSNDGIDTVSLESGEVKN